MEIKPKSRLLSDEEISDLQTKNSIKIKFDFGDRLDLKTKISHNEYSSFLHNIAIEFKGTPLERMMEELSLSFKLLSEKDKEAVYFPNLEYVISYCGGCGCGMGPSGPPGYAWGGACWCCPKPPNLPPM